ncbi:hypothetical protein MMA231_03403 [Asticcacaulis sp. MM231]
MSEYGYIDGFLIPVRKDNKDAYLKMAQMAAEVWKDHGAIDIVDMLGRRCARWQAHILPAGGETGTRRSGRLFLGHLAIKRGPRRRQREGYG